MVLYTSTAAMRALQQVGSTILDLSKTTAVDV